MGALRSVPRGSATLDKGLQQCKGHRKGRTERRPMTEKRWKSNSEVDRRPRPRLALLYLPASFVSGAFPCPVLPYQTLNT